jgi:hypothetical protein
MADDKKKPPAPGPAEQPPSQQQSFGTIKGTVVNVGDGNGIARVPVTLYTPSPNSTAIGTHDTDQNGKYSFPYLQPAPYVVVFPLDVPYPGGPSSIILHAVNPSGLEIPVNLATAAGTALEQVRDFHYTFSPGCIHGCITAKQASTCGTSVAETGLPDVPVALFKEGLPLARTVSGPNGCFEFPGLDCGSYDVVPAAQFQGLSSSPSSVHLSFLAPGQVVTNANFLFGPPLGSIKGRLVLQGGAGVPSQSGVKLLDPTHPSNAIPDQTTGQDGAFVFAVPPGSYQLTVPQSVASGVGLPDFQLAPNQQGRTVTSPSDVGDIVYISGPLIGLLTGQIQQLAQSVATIASITPTTMQASPSYQGAIPSSGSGNLPYDQVVEASLTRVLGARPNGDAVKILNLLNNSFTSKEQNGQTYYSWQPRGVTAVSSSMGQLVGGQVTIYQQAQDIQTQAARLLDAVEPIILDADADDIAAFKQDIAASVATIVSEAGRPGGAINARVNVLLQTLQGDLTTLGIKLGFVGVTDPALLIDMDVTEQEQNQENFALLNTLLGPNGTLGALLAKGTAPFRGTNLARLNWLVEVIPNTVQQIYAAMDSVGFGPADRRVTAIQGPGLTSLGASRLAASQDLTTIEQLLLWIESAASVDWPNRLVAGSARASEVRAVRDEADSQNAGVTKLVNSLNSIILLGADRPLPVLLELQRELGDVSTTAQAVIT